MKVQFPIDPLALTQGFGGNEAIYKKFGLKGHNGWDIKTKYPDTPQGKRNILAPQDVEMYRIGNDPPGYGLFLEVIVKTKNLWKITFAHCHSTPLFINKKQGETIAISDNTGNSTGAHLHITCKRIKIVNGKHEVINYNNGYFGAVDPQEYFDEVKNFNGSNTMPDTQITIGKEQYEKLVRNASIKEDVYKQLSIVNPDIASLEDFTRVWAGHKSTVTTLQSQLTNAQAEVKNREEQISRLKDDLLNKDKLITELQDNHKPYLERIKFLEGEVAQLGKKIGVLNIELAQCKSQSPINQLTVADVLILLFNKLKGVKLK